MSTLIRKKTISECKKVWGSNADISTTKPALSEFAVKAQQPLIIQSQLLKIIYNDKLLRKIATVERHQRR